MVHLPRRRSVSHNYLPGLLESQLRQLIPGHGRPLEGVDAGGSTGDLAASLVGQAFVTVIDSSLDALASLDRRTGQAGVNRRVHAARRCCGHCSAHW
jgi:S-adenosylmethionine-dependent methyltransferase